MDNQEPAEDLALRQAQQTLRLLPQIKHWGLALMAEGNLDPGVSLPQLALLQWIGAGEGSPVELARRQRVTPAVITKHVDRLVRRGYVQRETDPDDRRRLRLTLTAAGHALGDAAERALAESLAARLEAFSPEELATLGSGLALLERAFAAPDAGGHVAAAAPHPTSQNDHDQEDTPDE